jgi:hypothetical protein
MTRQDQHFMDESINDALEAAFQLIKDQCDFQIITDPSIVERMEQQIISGFAVFSAKPLSIIRLFEIKQESSVQYIAQVMLETPANISDKHEYVNRFTYYNVGIFQSSIDTGTTVMHPKTLADKIVSKLWGHEIDFGHQQTFHKKYYLTSDRKDAVLMAFKDALLEKIATENDIMFIGKGKEWLFFFDNDFQPEQASVLLSISKHIA